jgi:predicted DNA-binding protein
MNLEETKVRLSSGQKERIIALVGSKAMAAFIREAVEYELQRREGDEAAKAGSGSTHPRAGKHRSGP